MIIYSEQANTKIVITLSNFTRNYGYQGGVAFVDSDSTVNISSSNFDQNFAVIGGVAYQQSEGRMNLANCTYRENLALKASLFYLFNSQNAIEVTGGYMTMNGFAHSLHTIPDVFLKSGPTAMSHWRP